MNKLLLKLVQDVASEMNVDEVNSIGDTETSEQIAKICESVFYDHSELRNWGFRDELIQLEASGDSDQPTRMRLPIKVRRINWIRYNKQLVTDTETKFRPVTYKTPEEFIAIVQNRTVATDVIEVTDDIQSITYKIYTDRSPTYWTSFDDEYIWFDSHDDTVDTTLQTSKTLVAANVGIDFTISDTFDLPIPDKDFAFYRNLVFTRAFEIIKQMPHASASSMARQLLLKAQIKRGQRQAGGFTGVDYGRR